MPDLVGSSLDRIVRACLRAARRFWYRRYYRIHRDFQDFTMIPADTYATNLELVSRSCGVEGAVVECGTWRGGMIAGIARILGPGRHYALFDSFEGLPPVTAADGKAAAAWQSATAAPGYHDNCRAEQHFAVAAMSLAGAIDVSIKKGWFRDTLPASTFPTGISVLRLDADWYESTLQVLDSLFHQVVPGGLILVDDYYTWDGCSRAVHDFLSSRKRPEKITHLRGICYIVKLPDDDPSGEAGAVVGESA